MQHTETAKIFETGRSQAVRLPLKYRFDKQQKEVYIRRDEATGDLILSCRPDSWNDFFALYETTEIPADFMPEDDRPKDEATKNPFEGMIL